MVAKLGVARIFLLNLEDHLSYFWQRHRKLIVEQRFTVSRVHPKFVTMRSRGKVSAVHKHEIIGKTAVISEDCGEV